MQFQSKLPDQYPGLLHLAAKHGQLDLVKQLCAEKGQPLYDPDGELPDYTTPFEQSMIHGHQGVARYLLIHVKVCRMAVLFVGGGFKCERVSLRRCGLWCRAPGATRVWNTALPSGLHPLQPHGWHGQTNWLQRLGLGIW